MKQQRGIVVVLVCAVAFLVSFADVRGVFGEDVVVLTADTFENEVGRDKGALVEFYAPWCGHCKKLAPEYEKLGGQFKKAKGILIAKVDCDSHKAVCSKYGVSGFPTIKWFPKGSLEPSDYSGGRTAEALAEFVNEQAGTKVKSKTPPSDVVVLTPENFDSIVLDKSKDVLVEFYAPWCGHCKSLAPIYDEVAHAFKKEDDVVVAKVDADAHKDLGGRYGVTGFPTLKFFPKAQKEGVDYDGGRDLEDFVTYINEQAGTHRTSSGQLGEGAGIIYDLDVIAKLFVHATAEEKAVLIEKAEGVAATLQGTAASYAKTYMKSFKNVVEKGDGYAQKEVDRLQRILAGTVNPNKVDDFTVKKNILASFATQS